MKSLQSKLKAFTLVELLIVIVVIAILAAVSVVAYSGVNQRATNTSIQSSVASLERSLKMYLQEKGEPLQVSDTIGASYGVNMQGGAYVFDQYPACVGDWGSNATPSGGDCTNYMENTSISSDSVLRAYKTVLDASGMKDVFPKVGVPEIAVQEASNEHAFVHKGLRYAFTESSRRMFIYYAQHGSNSCMSGDLSIRRTHSTWDHPNRSWNDSWDRGGNFTSNGTTMCQRTIPY